MFEYTCPVCGRVSYGTENHADCEYCGEKDIIVEFID